MTLKITVKEDPDVVMMSAMHGFPCGETDCWSSPDCLFHAKGPGVDIRMPLCMRHADLVLEALGRPTTTAR